MQFMLKIILGIRDSITCMEESEPATLHKSTTLSWLNVEHLCKLFKLHQTLYFYSDFCYITVERGGGEIKMVLGASLGQSALKR